MSLPTVVVVDDHQVVTEGLVHLLRNQAEVLTTVSDGRLAAAVVARLRPDVVLLDISLPNVSGLEVIRQLRGTGVNSRLIVFTMHADAALAVEALTGGAAGFVLKDASAEELLAALRVVLEGGTYLPAAMTKEILTLMVSASEPRAELTAQQREVLRLVVQGQRAKEIASALDVSTRTVEAIKYKTMQQLDVHSTAELVRYAIEHRLVPL
jgi:DNA-binding NarL/FixJ family response regulator